MELERRGRVRRSHARSNWKQEDLDACDRQAVWSACLPDGSRVRRESHARFCERPVVKSRRPTHPFRPRLSRRRNGFGVSFSPAVSGKALKSIRQTVRHWMLHQRSDKTLSDLARMFNNHIRGWINYYGRFYKSAHYPALRHIDRILARWAHRKFKSLRRHKRRTAFWIARVARRQPSLFAHWGLLQGRGRTMGAG